MRNITSLKTVPWGTPDKRSSRVIMILLNNTLIAIKDLNQDDNESRIP